MSTGDYIAIYAAGLSTLLFVWEIVKYRTDKKSKMLVVGSVRQQALVYNNGQMGDFERFFWIEVTNRGNYQKFIQKPGFESNMRQGEKYHSLIDPRDKNSYPYALGPGQVYSYYFSLDSLDGVKQKGCDKIRIVVNDTNGKRYYSKWVQI